MSEALNIPASREPPRRGRPPRAEAQADVRRRRNPGSLDRMQQFKLDIFSDPPKCLNVLNDKSNNTARFTQCGEQKDTTGETTSWRYWDAVTKVYVVIRNA